MSINVVPCCLDIICIRSDDTNYSHISLVVKGLTSSPFFQISSVGLLFFELSSEVLTYTQ